MVDGPVCFHMYIYDVYRGDRKEKCITTTEGKIIVSTGFRIHPKIIRLKVILSKYPIKVIIKT